jgi:PAS domain S-box-containing protein
MGATSIPAEQFHLQRKRFRTVVACFMLASTGVAALVGYLVLMRNFTEERDQAANKLGDIAEIATTQILNWRNDKEAEASYLGHAPLLARAVRDRLKNSRSQAGSEIRATLDLVKKNFDYEAVDLYLANGRPVLPSSGSALSPNNIELIRRAIGTREVEFSKPQAVLGTDGLTLGIATPLVDDSTPKPIAVLFLRVRLQESLSPLLRSSRTSSRTLDSVLFTFVEGKPVFLNRPRFRVSHPMPIPQIESSSAEWAVNGPQIIPNMRDYRGHSVIAAIRSVPGTDWGLITKMDEEEVDAELRGRAALVAAVFAFFLLAQTLGVALLWHSKEANQLSQWLREEKEQREVFERLALLMSSANDAVLVTNRQGRILEANEAAAQLYEFSLEVLKSMFVDDLRLSQLEVVDGDEPVREEEHVGKAGSPFPVEVSKRTVDWAGEPHTILVIRDIRVRKESESQLQETIQSLEQAMEAIQTSEQRFRSFVEASSLTVWRADPLGNVFELSDNYEEVTGIARDSAYGKGWLEALHPDDRPAATESWQSAIDHRKPLEIEVRRKAASGEYRYLEVRAVPIVDKGGKVLEWVGASRDIHEQRQAEQFLLQTQKMEALGNLAGGIAHDFNNILRAIAGNVRLAFEGLPQGHSSRHALTQVEKSCYRAFNLVQQVLTFSRQTETKPCPVDLAKIVDEAISLLRPTIPSNVELILKEPVDLPNVRSDPSQAHQAFLNLFANAAQAMEPKGGQIEIDLAKVLIEEGERSEKVSPGEYVRLSVSDTGPGIDPATQKRIFEPFFTTKPQGQGTGLGLSVVHGIMATHGGMVEVESQVGEGTRFHLYFPVTYEALKTISRPEHVTKSGMVGRILYVDDDESLIRLASRSLPRKGIEVRGVSSPEEAICIFKSDPQQFDAIVTDITMPTMSGFELAQRLLEIRSDIPIIAMSGFIRNEDADQAKRIGIHKVLLKTLGDDDLVDALYFVTERKEAIPV